MADIGDVIELTTDLPAHNLRAGTQGAIVHCHSGDAYEVEFADSSGETRELLALRREQFLITWRAATRQAVPVWERVAALLRTLPEDSGREVLDFTQFLALRQHRGVASSA
jgi:hypothetical protein